jgi:very-short-patch-repair endonuclease
MPQTSSSYQENLFYGASQLIMSRAIELMKKLTPAEIVLWKYLKNKQLLGLRFRRQHPIVMFIVDFYCHYLKFVIELDGGIHKEPTDPNLLSYAGFRIFG